MSEVLIALAERVEAATGADKRLGAEVEIAVCGFPQRAYDRENGMRAKGSPNLDKLEWAANWFGAGPTRSLDLAMTLVPDGFMWRVQSWPDGVNEAILEKGAGDFGAIDARHTATFAASPALALTAAALRAIAARTS